MGKFFFASVETMMRGSRGLWVLQGGTAEDYRYSSEGQQRLMGTLVKGSRGLWEFQ